MQKSPFLRLLSVTAVVLVMGITGVLFLRWLGNEQQYASTPHPWMQREHWLVARLAPEDCSQLALEDLLELDNSWFIWIDVQATEGELQMVCPTSHIFEVRADAKPGPKLERVLPMLRDRSVIFNIRAVDISVTPYFLKALAPWAEKAEVGIASTSQAFIRDLRKKRADWLFAGDASAWTKLKFFANFGLETVIELWPDFFVASSDPNEPNYFTKAAADEINRRKKVLLLEMENTPSVDPSWKRSLRGILTTRPKNFPTDTFFKKTGAE